MRLPPLSIRTRLTLIYTGVLFLTLVFSGVTGAWLLHERMTARMHASLAARLQGLEGFLQRETDPDATPEHMAEETLEYALTQPEGHLVDVQEETSGRVLLKSEPVRGPVAQQTYTFALHGRRYAARASASLAPIDEAQWELLRLLWISGPLLLAVSAVSGYWLSRRAFAPVDELTRTARGIGLTDLGQRVPVPPTRDELARLAEAWNEMLARLESSVGQVRRFTADAAHELRTPLSILRTTAELALRKPREPQEYREALADVVRSSAGLAQLVDGLLLLARGDAGVGPAVREPVDLSSLTRDAAAGVAGLFDARQVALTINGADADTAVVLGDAAALRRLLMALLENAAQHTPAGGRVTVTVSNTRSGSMTNTVPAVTPAAEWRSESASISASAAPLGDAAAGDVTAADEEIGERVVVEVRDTGAGIAAPHLARIFDRFYRADAARDRESGGHGLGLAIAQQAARAHGGEVTVSSRPGEGACFRVTLPAAPPAIRLRARVTYARGGPFPSSPESRDSPPDR